MKNVYLILILLTTYSIAIRVHKERKNDDLTDWLKTESEKEKDPLFYSSEIYKNSFKDFVENFLEVKNIDISVCYYEMRERGVNSSRLFLVAYNNVVTSAEDALRNNKSFDIKGKEVCKYDEKTNFGDAMSDNKDYAKNTYLIAQNYFTEMINSDFWINFLKFNYCYTHEKSNSSPNLKWNILGQYSSYLKIFENFCSIQNLFFHFDTEVYKKTLLNPFVFLGEKMRNFFELIRPHLNNMEKQLERINALKK